MYLDYSGTQETQLAPYSVLLRAQIGYPGVQVIHTGFPKYFTPHLSTYCSTYSTRHSQSVANFLNVPKFQPKIHKSTKPFGFSFAFDAPLFGIHFLKTLVHHPLLPLLERSSKPISTQRHILLSSFSLMASPWCWPISVPGYLNLDIAIVLLRLRVHYSVAIKCYKSHIRIRILIYLRTNLPIQRH